LHLRSTRDVRAILCGVSTTVPNPTRDSSIARRKTQLEGLRLLVGIVAVMWIVEVFNTLDSNGLNSDGIYARNVNRLWGIMTAPFIHVSFAHLIGNTIPLVFMGLIIALRGAASPRRCRRTARC